MFQHARQRPSRQYPVHMLLIVCQLAHRPGELCQPGAVYSSRSLHIACYGFDWAANAGLMRMAPVGDTLETGVWPPV